MVPKSDYEFTIFETLVEYLISLDNLWLDIADPMWRVVSWDDANL